VYYRLPSGVGSLHWKCEGSSYHCCSYYFSLFSVTSTLAQLVVVLYALWCCAKKFPLESRFRMLGSGPPGTQPPDGNPSTVPCSTTIIVDLHVVSVLLECLIYHTQSQCCWRSLHSLGRQVSNNTLTLALEF